MVIADPRCTYRWGHRDTTSGVSEPEYVDPPVVRVPALDGLRGIAVLLVVGLHTAGLRPSGIFWFFHSGGPFNGGFLGVDIFFVLSGFLITDLLLREQRRHGRISFPRFWRARAFRLLPALAAALTALMVWSAISGYPSGGSPELVARNVVAASTFTLNWLPTFDIDGAISEIGHLWSLAVEEQFYIFWPLVVATLLSIRRSRRWVTIGLVGATIAVAVWRSVVYDRHGWLNAYIRTDTRIDGLVIGALLAWLTARGWRLGRRAATIAGRVGVVGLIAAGAFFLRANLHLLYRGGFTLVAISTGAVVVAIMHGPWAEARVLSFAPLRAVGRVSYGLYIWHYPIFYAVERTGQNWPGWLRVVVGFGITAAVVTASWNFIERPAQALRRRIDRAHAAASVHAARPRLRIVAPIGVVCGAVLLGVGVARGRLRPSVGRGEMLPDLFSLRTMAFFQFEATPPRGQLLADAFSVGGAGAYDMSRVLPAVVRIPVLALSPHLHPGFIAVSVVLAWVLIVASTAGIAVRVVQRATATGRRAWSVSLASGVVGLVGLVAGFVCTRGSSAQSTEWKTWAVAASLLWVYATLGIVSDRRVGRLVVFVVATAALAASAGPFAWVAVGGCVVVGGVLSIRRLSWAVLVVPIAAVVPALLLVVADGSSGVASPGLVQLGWQMPATSTADDLFVSGDCEGFSAGTGVTTPWSSASTPEFVLKVTFWKPPKRAGRVTLVSIPSTPSATVVMESDDHKRVRYVFEHAGTQSSTGWLVMPPIDIQSIVAAVDADRETLIVRANGYELGRVPVFDPVTGATVVPAVVLEDARQITGAKITLDKKPIQFPELCRAARDHALSAARPVAVLPSHSQPGDLLIVGDCTGMYAGTGLSVRPWAPVEAKPTAVRVSFPDGKPAKGTWPVATDRQGTDTGLRLESDGTGRVRYRVGAPFVDTVGPWLAIDSSSVHDVRIDFSGPADAYDFSIDGSLLGSVPASTEDPDNAARRVELTFAVAASPSDEAGNPATSPGSSSVSSSGSTSPDFESQDVFSPPLCAVAQAQWQGVVQHVNDLATATPSAGALAVVGDCRGLYSATGEPTDQWVPLDVPAFQVDVRYPTAASGVSEQEIVRIAADPLMRVIVETDGAGRRRYRAAVPFLSADGRWERVKADTVDELDVELASDGQNYVIRLNATTIGQLPALQQDPDGSTRRFTPSLAGRGPDAEQVKAVVRPPDSLALCSRLVAQSTDG